MSQKKKLTIEERWEKSDVVQTHFCTYDLGRTVERLESFLRLPNLQAVVLADPTRKRATVLKNNKSSRQMIQFMLCVAASSDSLKLKLIKNTLSEKARQKMLSDYQQMVII